jgi:hypothetical protein
MVHCLAPPFRMLRALGPQPAGPGCDPGIETSRCGNQPRLAVVGAVSMARAVNDAAVSREILTSAASNLKEQLG